ncbi:restriction endonuclease [Gallibacterium anatis]|nr:restriction endonuclease [Gallibacterium anatis]WIM81513.1 restriction endonuclease [Gallibacterium anatis]
MAMLDKKITLNSELPRAVDISETKIREEMPEILNILLLNRSTSSKSQKTQNIIWANDNYIALDKNLYAPTAQILPELITGKNGQVIMPRALKSMKLQKERTKFKAEVFTPLFIVKKQNDVLEESYLNDDLETYIKRTWLEIACGEAPYIASRYDMETGDFIELENRVGFLDRKLQRINQECKTRFQWKKFTTLAYQASYGFEWNGDSLLLARENLLYTCQDYYLAKWQEEIPYDFLKKIARIISYNLFQMDGIERTLPLEGEDEKQGELDLFPSKKNNSSVSFKRHRIKIMNWKTQKLEFFDEVI